jgi:tetratricopeptide (TPR) repeat protein
MMFKSMTAAILLLAAAASSAQAASAVPSKCKLVKLAELPVTMDNLVPLVPVKINGQETHMIADTGAFFSTLSTISADQFGIKGSMAPPGAFVVGVGGREGVVKIGKAKEFAFSDLPPFHDISFLISPHEFASGTAGLLGQNVLGGLDVEYDLANGMIRIFKSQDCGDSILAYWAAGKPLSAITIPARSTEEPHILGDAKIDGKSIKVMFDTGSPVSYVSRPAAARVGIRADSDGVTAAGITSGVTEARLETWLAPFASFAIGDEEIKNTRLRVANIELSRGADMLIGADFFLSHRVFVANSQRKLYFTYNGGSVFRLGSAPQQQAATSASETKAGDAPQTVDDFSRRAAASLSRRDYAAAIADFTRATELEPTVAKHFYDRALAYFWAGQPTPGMADLNQALKLKPDDMRALLSRAEVYAKAKDAGRAQADLDAVARLSPQDLDDLARMSWLYDQLGHFDRAAAMYSDWIGRHPQDPGLWQALNGRCWARAISGQDLNAALTDCDDSIRRKPRISANLDSRGLVLLRMGRFDESIAAYDAALKLQPGNGWSLYCRGLAKQAKGLKTEGDADIKAALAINPALPKQAERYGLAKDAGGAKPAARSA